MSISAFLIQEWQKLLNLKETKKPEALYIPVKHIQALASNTEVITYTLQWQMNK